jgi:hypothetical protein
MKDVSENTILFMINYTLYIQRIVSKFLLCLLLFYVLFFIKVLFSVHFLCDDIRFVLSILALLVYPPSPPKKKKNPYSFLT